MIDAPATPATISRRAKLTIDVGPLFEDQWTGISVFTRRLIQALIKHENIQLAYAANLVDIPTEAVLRALAFESGGVLGDARESRPLELVKTVDPSAPLFYPMTRAKFGAIGRDASTVHDLSTLFMPENHVETNVAYNLDHFERELRTNEAVFCISEATRAGMATAFPSVAGKLRLLPQYVDWPESFETLDRNLAPIRLGAFAAVVGTIEPRKNLALLLEALEHPRLAALDLTFVVIGKPGWLVDSSADRLTAEQRKRVVFTGFVSEFVKYRLLKAAQFLIFPSVFEGFGIPALEAMSLGKPVLAARSSSLPEVIGGAGCFFDPYSQDDFLSALEEIAAPRKLADLAPIARAQNARYTPERMARPVAEWARG